MRQPLTARLLHRFIERLGQEVSQETTCYLVGGASAVIVGWRSTTRDIDLKFVPDLPELGQIISQLKNELQVNVEQASPDDFIPLPSGWEERSPLTAQSGKVSVRHFDFYSQALAKIERSHANDIRDVQSMFNEQLVDPRELRRYFEEIEPQLLSRFAIDPGEFRRNLDEALDAFERPDRGIESPRIASPGDD
jgi:hypothetical protein